MKTATKTQNETVVEPAPPVQLPAEVKQGDIRFPAPAVVFPSKVAKAILAVQKTVGHIRKDGTNNFQHYKYARWEDVTEALSPLLAEHGLIIVQSEVSRNILEKSDHGSIMAIVYQFTIVHEDGDHWPAVEWTALARLSDQKGIADDKAAAKAHTQAEKYFSMKAFKIRTENEEIDSDKDGVRRKAPDPEPEPPAKPSQIVVTKGGAKAWTRLYLAAVRKATSRRELDAWALENQSGLEKLGSLAAAHNTAADEKGLAKQVSEACQRRYMEFDGEVSTSSKPAPRPLPPRVGQNGTHDAAADTEWLKELSHKLIGCQSKTHVMDVEAAEMSPQKHASVSSATWQTAVEYIREHMERFKDTQNYAQQLAFVGEDWLKGDYATAIASAATVDELETIKDKTLLPSKEMLTVAEWKQAVKMYRERLGEIDPDEV